jgi:hypothetical protein
MPETKCSCIAGYGALVDGEVRKRRASVRICLILAAGVVRKAGCTLYIEMRINDQEARTLAFAFSSKTLIANDAISRLR